MVAMRLMDTKMCPLPRLDPVLQRSRPCLSFAMCKRFSSFLQWDFCKDETTQTTSSVIRTHSQAVPCSFPVPHRFMICCFVRLTSLLCHKHPLSVCDNEWLMYRQMQLKIMALLFMLNRHKSASNLFSTKNSFESLRLLFHKKAGLSQSLLEL